MGRFKSQQDTYAEFAEHPRYGRRPCFNDLVPKVGRDEKFVMMTMCRGGIKGTAIEADMESQHGAAYYFKYYFDEALKCVDCFRQFIFFAKEKKYRCDALGYHIDAVSTRCYDCRQVKTASKRNQKRYGELQHIENRTLDQNIEMAEICLSLLEDAYLGMGQVQIVRMLLNSIARQDETNGQLEPMLVRLHDYEAVAERIKADIAQAGALPGYNLSKAANLEMQFRAKMSDHWRQIRVSRLLANS